MHSTKINRSKLRSVTDAMLMASHTPPKLISALEQHGNSAQKVSIPLNFHLQYKHCSGLAPEIQGLNDVTLGMYKRRLMAFLLSCPVQLQTCVSAQLRSKN
jgi:hypothetical protein